MPEEDPIMRKLIFLLSFVLLISLAGQAVAGAKREASAATITMQHWGPPEQTTLHEAQAALFNEEYPEIIVNIEAVPANEYFTKMLTDAAAGTAADILMNNASAQVDTPTKIFMPLDDYMKDRNAGLDKDDLLESLWFYNESGGKTWSIPISFVVRSVFYNKDLFDAIGRPYPENDWTWPEFVETSNAFDNDSNDDGLVDTIGFDLSFSAAHEWFMWLFSAGGDIVDLDNKEAIFNSQAGYDALKLYIDAAKSFEIGPSPLGIAAGVSFLTNQAALIDQMPVARVMLPVLGVGRFGVVRMPKHPDHPRANMAAGETLGISPDSEHPWESWLWIRSMVMYDGQKLWTDLGWGFPSNQELLADMDMTDPMNEAFWLDAQTNWYEKMWYHGAGDVESLVNEMIQEAMLTHQNAGFDLQALLDKFAADATEALRED